MIPIKVFLISICLSGAWILPCQGQAYRYFGHSRYKIIDTAGFYLYSINKLVQGEKIARPQTVYYFSKDLSAPVQELTLANLEKVFASNTRFRYRLEGWTRSDKDLIAYDKVQKEYKIKVLYGMPGN